MNDEKMNLDDVIAKTMDALTATGLQYGSLQCYWKFFVQIKKPNHNKTCWGCCKCKVSFRNGRAISTVEQQAAHWQSDKGRT